MLIDSASNTHNAELEAFQQQLDQDERQEILWFETDHLPAPATSCGTFAELGVAGSGLFHHPARPSLDELDGNEDPDSFE